MATNLPAYPAAHPSGLNPDTIDTLNELAYLLTRLRTPASTSTDTTKTTGATPSQTTQTQTQSQPGELALKEVPAATDALKHRFQKARAQLRARLPDLDRGIPEQEAEIAALEARLARQRETLTKLREVGARTAAGAGDGDRMVE